jgi:D-alanyl-D-alanine carboxypeptidase
MYKKISLARAVLTAGALAIAAPIFAPISAQAMSLYDEPKYAAILINPETHEVLYSRRADLPRYPASITKVMTLYLTFEALEEGKLKLTDPVVISRHAAAQPPSKLGLGVGKSLTVEQAIRVIAVKSANDIAAALAEKIAGSESTFAAKMTGKARALGMMNTYFANASGLPNPRHLTTARDIAILSMALLEDYPQYYRYFGQQQYVYGKQVLNNHNKLLGKMPGVDGIKTGYTAAAGFTLAASATRNGKRLIAVVLGGPSTMARDQNVSALLDAGFDVLDRRIQGVRTTVAANLNEPADYRLPGTAAAIEQGSGDDSVTGVSRRPAR